MKTLDLREGGAIAYGTKEETMISGTVKEAVTNETFVHTFRFGHSPSEDETEPDTLVTYTIEAKGSGSTLTLRHSGFPSENQTYTDIAGGWPIVLNRLKQAIEAEPAGGAYRGPAGGPANAHP